MHIAMRLIIMISRTFDIDQLNRQSVLERRSDIWLQ